MPGTGRPGADEPGADGPAGVRLLVPAKALDRAKTRLALPPDVRLLVARALVERTLAVASEAVGPARVTVVTDGADVRRLAAPFDVDVLDESAGELNSALDLGIGHLRRLDPPATCVVLVSDLPLINVADLSEVLARVDAASTPQHVVDLHGSGTTLLALPAGATLPLGFGPGSARHFTEAGSRLLDPVPASLRTDLDTLADLEELPAPARDVILSGGPRDRKG